MINTPILSRSNYTSENSSVGFYTRHTEWPKNLAHFL